MSKYDDEDIIRMKKSGYSWDSIAEKYGVSNRTIRNYAYSKPWYEEIKSEIGHNNKFGKKMHTEPKDSITHSIKIKLKEGQLLTESELLKLHGFEPLVWEIVSGKSNEWTTPIEGNPFYNYQSTITVKPRTKMSIEMMTNAFKGKIEPIVYKNKKSGKNNLVIALADMHWGITKIEDVVNKLQDIKRRIEQGFKTIVIENLGDLFHSSQLQKSVTLSGTILDEVNMVQAIEDAKVFFEAALENAEEVRLECVIGNHEDQMYLFHEVLRERYPQLKVNNHIKWRHCYQLDKVGIMMTHGHANKLKELPLLFATEYTDIWSKSVTRENHSGHLHQAEKEIGSVILRQFGTAKKPDPYEIKNGWTTNRKVIQLVEYNTERPVAVYEV
ncbi:helix-turn-helix domain-containing protein [Streptococcus uberis]|uniref:helix-turn-helix domain-containing protein n=1 Tax=Streptococcus uberis TaxID=1349 RepID=UPI003D6A4A0F